MTAIDKFMKMSDTTVCHLGELHGNLLFIIFSYLGARETRINSSKDSFTEKNMLEEEYIWAMRKKELKSLISYCILLYWGFGHTFSDLESIYALCTNKDVSNQHITEDDYFADVLGESVGFVFLWANPVDRWNLDVWPPDFWSSRVLYSSCIISWSKHWNKLRQGVAVVKT